MLGKGVYPAKDLSFHIPRLFYPKIGEVSTDLGDGFGMGLATQTAYISRCMYLRDSQ